MSDINHVGNMNFQVIRDIGTQSGAPHTPKVKEEPVLLNQGETFVPSSESPNNLLMDKIKNGGFDVMGLGNHELEPTLSGQDFSSISGKFPEVAEKKTFETYYGVDNPDSYYGFSLNGPSSNSIVGLSGQELK